MQKCPNCGTELEEEEAGGFCGACLMAGAFGTEAVTADAPAAAPGSPGNAPEQESFGNYRIVRMLGEGGMGTVYLAEQTHPFRRQVALKVIKPGMDSGQILSRFEYERQALALMDHPNIARVHDAAVTEKGRPYFVMEYIDGLPITDYCDSHRLNTQERLAIFIPVCLAVQHAHQKGVIHRDIKPSNVMVTEKDGRPVPKVIDFGISKATDQRGVENALFTQFGQFVGTPEYMSPEQADVVTGDIDTGSDIYSLGVLLYELLVGSVPFEGAMLRKAGLAELLRIVREEEAPAMHAKLTSMGKTATDVAARRRTDQASLRRQLAGDLNWIVSKAVEKNRQRRYASVSDLSADICRHIEDRPVLASPPSRIYLARKFAKRHRAGVLAGVGIVATLVAGLIATAWEGRIARHERADAIAQKTIAESRGREAKAERGRAETEAANARREEQAVERQKTVAESRLNDVRALANSMVFELDDQVRDLPGATKARETLTRLGIEYLTKVSEQAEGNQQLERQLGAAYLKVGDLQGNPGRANTQDIEGARKSYARSVEILEKQVRDSPRDRELRLSLSTAYLRRGQLEESEQAQKSDYGRAKETAGKLLAEDPNDLRAMSGLAEAMLAAEPREGRRAVEILERVAAKSPDSLPARWQLARAQIAFGNALTYNDDDQALDMMTRGVESLNGLIAEDPANIQYKRDRAEGLSLSGVTLTKLGRFEDALERARAAVAIQEQVSAADPRNAAFRRDLLYYRERVAFALHNNGGNSTEVMENLRNALAVQEREAAEQPRNPGFRMQVAETHNFMAGWAQDIQAPAAALPHLRAAETIYRELMREYPGQRRYARALAQELLSLASVVTAVADKSAAVSLNRESLAIWDRLCSDKEAIDEDFAGMANAHAWLAWVYGNDGRVEGAIGEERIAIAAYERATARSTKGFALRRSLAHVYTNLSAYYEDRRDWKSALDQSLKAAAILEADYAAHPGEPAFTVPLWETLNYLAIHFRETGQIDRTIETRRRIVAISERSASLQTNDRQRAANLANAYLDLSVACVNAGRRADSLGTLRQLVAFADRTPLEDAPAPIQGIFSGIYLRAIGLLHDWAEPEEALPLTRRVLPVVEKLNVNDSKNAAYRATLVNAYRSVGKIMADLGDWPATIEVCTKAMRVAMEVPEDTSAFWGLNGKATLSIAAAWRITGANDKAAERWREALEMFQRSRRFAERARSATKLDLLALRNMATADKWIAFTREQLGDLREALNDRKEAASFEDELAKADPASPSYRERAADARGALGRLQLSMGLDGATPRPIGAEVALGWRVSGTEYGDVSDAPSSLESFMKATETDRLLVAQDPQMSLRLALATDLQRVSWGYIRTAGSSKDAQRMSAYRGARRAAMESRDIFVAVKKMGDLTPENELDLSLARNCVEIAEAKLGQAIETAAGPR